MKKLVLLDGSFNKYKKLFSVNINLNKQFKIQPKPDNLPEITLNA